MSTWVLPVQWKVSIILLLCMNELLYDPQSYRPINWASVLARLMEGILKDRLTGLLTTTDLTGESCRGFLKRGCCSSCNFEIVTWELKNPRRLPSFIWRVSFGFVSNKVISTGQCRLLGESSWWKLIVRMIVNVFCFRRRFQARIATPFWQRCWNQVNGCDRAVGEQSYTQLER